MLKFSSFILKRISIKFDVNKMIKFVDLGFILLEKFAVKLDKLLPIYLEFNDKMIENEIELAKISNKDKILHIGCGAIPATSILLAKKTGAQVTGIDNDFLTIKQALICLSKLKLSDKVQVKHVEAETFPVQMFDLIIVSQGVKPYYEILKYIAQSMSPDARVIFRTSSTINGDLFESDMFIKNIFRIDKKVYQKQNGLLLSILLIKQS